MPYADAGYEIAKDLDCAQEMGLNLPMVSPFFIS
jgi:hypothetical protein